MISDFKAELTEKFGTVVHVGIQSTGNEFDIYVKFAEESGATQAMNGLNGRIYAGFPLRATYVTDFMYHAMFPVAN